MGGGTGVLEIDSKKLTIPFPTLHRNWMHKPFEDVDDFNKCVKVIKQSNHRYYKLNVNQEISKFYVEVYDDARFGNLEYIVHIYKWSHAIVSVGRQ